MSQELVGDGDIEITRARNRNYALGEGSHRMARPRRPFGAVMSASRDAWPSFESKTRNHFFIGILQYYKVKAPPRCDAIP